MFNDLRFPGILNVGGVLVMLGDHPVEDVHDILEDRDLGDKFPHQNIRHNLC